MYQSDYILRIIEQFTTVLRRMIASLREARPEETLELSDEALGLALGIDPSVATSLDADSIMFLANTSGEEDPVRLLLIAETLALRYEALRDLGDLEAAAREETRVLAIAGRAMEHAPSERISEMLSLLGSAYSERGGVI